MLGVRSLAGAERAALGERAVEHGGPGRSAGTPAGRGGLTEVGPTRVSATHELAQALAQLEFVSCGIEVAGRSLMSNYVICRPLYRLLNHGATEAPRFTPHEFAQYRA